MKHSLQFIAEHIFAVHSFKDWRQCTDASQRIAYFIDNRRRGDYIQRGDVENESDKNIGDNIFSLFLSLVNRRLTSIIRLKPHIDKNSTYLQILQTELQYKDRRLTRQFRSPNLVQTTATYPTSSGRKKYHKRAKRGSGKQKMTVKKSSQKVIEKFMKHETFKSTLL